MKVPIPLVGSAPKLDLSSGVQIGKCCRIRRAIIDKWIEIPEGVEIGYDRDADEERFHLSPSGIAVIPPGYRFE